MPKSKKKAGAKAESKLPSHITREQQKLFDEIDRGRTEEVKKLIEAKKVDLTIPKPNTFYTPLMYAAKKRRAEIIALLLEAKADPYWHMGDELLPYHECLVNNDERTAVILIKAMVADPIKFGLVRDGLFLLAMENKSSKVIAAFFEITSPELRVPVGTRTFALKQILKRILEHSMAELKSRKKKVSFAEEIEFIQLLINQGAQVDRTFLMLACGTGNEALVSVLMEDKSIDMNFLLEELAFGSGDLNKFTMAAALASFGLYKIVIKLMDRIDLRINFLPLVSSLCAAIRACDYLSAQMLVDNYYRLPGRDKFDLLTYFDINPVDMGYVACGDVYKYPLGDVLTPMDRYFFQKFTSEADPGCAGIHEGEIIVLIYLLTLIDQFKTHPKYQKLALEDISHHVDSMVALSNSKKCDATFEFRLEDLRLLVPHYLNLKLRGVKGEALKIEFAKRQADMPHYLSESKAWTTGRLHLPPEKYAADEEQKKAQEAKRIVLSEQLLSLPARVAVQCKENVLLLQAKEIKSHFAIVASQKEKNTKRIAEGFLDFDESKKIALLAQIGRALPISPVELDVIEKYYQKDVFSEGKGEAKDEIAASQFFQIFSVAYQAKKSVISEYIAQNKLAEAEKEIKLLHICSFEKYENDKKKLQIILSLLNTQTEKLTNAIKDADLAAAHEKRKIDKHLDLIAKNEARLHAQLEELKQFKAECEAAKREKAEKEIASAVRRDAKAEAKASKKLSAPLEEPSVVALVPAASAISSSSSPHAMFKFKLSKKPIVRMSCDPWFKETLDRVGNILTITDDLDVLEKAIHFSLGKSTIVDRILELTIQRDVMLVICGRLLEILASAHRHLPLLNKNTQHVRDVIFCHEEDLLNPITEHNCAAIQDKMGGVIEMALEMVGCLREKLNNPTIAEDKTEIVLSSPLFKRWLKQDIQEPRKENRHQYVRSLKTMQPKLEALHGHIDADLLRYAIDAQKAKIDKYQQKLGKSTQSREDRKKAKSLRHGRAVVGSESHAAVSEETTAVTDFPALMPAMTVAAPVVSVAATSLPLFRVNQHRDMGRSAAPPLPSGAAVAAMPRRLS